MSIQHHLRRPSVSLSSSFNLKEKTNFDHRDARCGGFCVVGIFAQWKNMVIFCKLLTAYLQRDGLDDG